MNNFREWLSDNLRYILLGVAGILLIVIAFFAVRLIQGLSGSSEKETEVQKNTEIVAENQVQETERSVINLVRNQEDVLNLVTRYYNARASKDYDTLAALCETFDDDTRTEIERQDSAIESYSNIMTYSKNGLTSDSYIVYVYFDAKLSGITTPAPSLRELYLVTNAEDELVISDKESSQELKDFTEALRADEDVQALIADVNKKLAEAEEQDEDLKNFIESGVTEPADDDNSEGDAEPSGTGSGQLGTMYANTGVNVRGTPSTDGVLYGTLYEGMEVEVLENLDNGWSNIQYTYDGTTIIGYVMTEYLSAAQ